MRKMTDPYQWPSALTLGRTLNERVPAVDQKRQRGEVLEILKRLRDRPGVILADEVGMGKTFVALAVAYSVATQSKRGPAIVMVPPNLIEKWTQDLATFCDLYLEDQTPVRRDEATPKELRSENCVRFGVARHSVELMKLLDDPPRERCHLIFLGQGAMSRRQTDKWVRLALIAETLRRHATGKAARLIKVKKQIHRFVARLIWAIGEERLQESGENIWWDLLRQDTSAWKDTYNASLQGDKKKLSDDPVPKAVARALQHVQLRPLASALSEMPLRERGGKDRVAERIDSVRQVLREAEKELWSSLLARAKWRSPLLVMDEAHHLKNPGTRLARQLQSPDSESDLKTGDGAMAQAFDRMLFLTATPFQLGHHELVRVLERFRDVRWDSDQLGDRADFDSRLRKLGDSLTESQRTAIGLQRAWARLRKPETIDAVETWWTHLTSANRETLEHRERAVVDAFVAARNARVAAEEALRPWVVRHNKGDYWADTIVARRQRIVGAAIRQVGDSKGLPIPSEQLLPFFLAARSAVRPGQDLLGEALCSSYEAFRLTRSDNRATKDDDEESDHAATDLALSRWYLGEFDRAIERCAGASHPKMSATVTAAVNLWEAGEKVLVFAFYRHTCRALRIHISAEIERRLYATAKERLRKGARDTSDLEIDEVLDDIQDRFFDRRDQRDGRTLDDALRSIANSHELARAQLTDDELDKSIDIMRRFLRVRTTLIRAFPLSEYDSLTPKQAISMMLNHADQSSISWKEKFIRFLDCLAESSPLERANYLDATGRTQTRAIRVQAEEDDSDDDDASKKTLANIQVATGETKRNTRERLMRSFNTPFFPDILVCSSVMGEGVDLQRFCRHVIHHDLAWNPSTIEQRTGRIDRLGCKAEGKHSIHVYLPYIAATADERQYRVMTDRERWFRIVMGQEQVAKLVAADSDELIPIPDSLARELNFELDTDSP